MCSAAQLYKSTPSRTVCSPPHSVRKNRLDAQSILRSGKWLAGTVTGLREQRPNALHFPRQPLLASPSGRGLNRAYPVLHPPATYQLSKIRLRRWLIFERSDTTPKNRLRIQSISPNRVRRRKYGSGRRGLVKLRSRAHSGAVPGWAE